MALRAFISPRPDANTVINFFLSLSCAIPTKSGLHTKEKENLFFTFL